jgi:ABC-2 type transport system ATP-binding protein/lipopolysaccharide transport system ATP-binding protein
MSSPVITLEHITIRYRAPEERIGTLKEYAIRLLQRRIRFKEFLALNDVSMEVEQGEILGLIGRNGAGKSTMLKVISRVLYPTGGHIRICGRVAPLLELGAGFHPELTGRENVLLNGTLLGHKRRAIEDRMGAVMDFAELGAFIDAPLRTYSSGMMARLGFAVATAWQPDILLVDEVLAVGDEPFQRKCYARMDEFREGGTTIILVTHNMETILSLCSRAAWLDHGKLQTIGLAEEVVQQYRSAQG